MTKRSREYSGAIAAHSAFSKAEVIVDVGGGEGQLVIDILRAHDGVSGIVFDLPNMAEAAKTLINEAHMTDRCRFVAGDMFHTVPPAGDVYLLKWVLHDWNDEKALVILNRVAEAMTDGSQLLIVERLMPETIDESTGLVQADLNMLCQNDGAERTLGEYRAILDKANMQLLSSDLVETRYGFHVLQAKKRLPVR